MRTLRAASDMAGSAECELDARAGPRRRIDGQLGAGKARALPDDHRSNPPLIQFVRRQPPLELEPAAVVFDDQPEGVIVACERHEDVSGLAVPADVGQCLLDDADDLEGTWRWQ